MSSGLVAPLTPDDLQLLELLRLFTENNGLTEFGKDYIPPRYTDPNYVPPHIGHGLLVMGTVLLVVTCLVVAGRYYARLFIAGGVGADDITIGIATVSSMSNECRRVDPLGNVLTRKPQALFIGSSSMYCFGNYKILPSSIRRW